MYADRTLSWVKILWLIYASVPFHLCSCKKKEITDLCDVKAFDLHASHTHIKIRC